MPPHYPPQSEVQNRGATGLHEIEGIPRNTQQSYAPSQKTLVNMSHNQAVSPQNSQVYHSHATT